eukprot:15445060-Alexandrium_andersonii.AAC.1
MLSSSRLVDVVRSGPGLCLALPGLFDIELQCLQFALNDRRLASRVLRVVFTLAVWHLVPCPVVACVTSRVVSSPIQSNSGRFGSNLVRRTRLFNFESARSSVYCQGAVLCACHVDFGRLPSRGDGGALCATGSVSGVQCLVYRAFRSSFYFSLVCPHIRAWPPLPCP